MKVRSVIVKEAVREEREIWKLALRAVRCILPDDAADVEEEAKRIRMGIPSRRESDFTS